MRRSGAPCGVVILFAVVLAVSSAHAQPCSAPNNGSGTIDFPPDCPFANPDEDLRVELEVPPGGALEFGGPLEGFANRSYLPGGILGGGINLFTGQFTWDIQGTGLLTGYQRQLVLPTQLEVHAGALLPAPPGQIFETELVSLSGELFGDPDFCLLRLEAGQNFGFPSPGQTTLAELPDGNFAVDSFFDVTYRIEFEGCPGSPLDGMLGTTTATIRLETPALRIDVNPDPDDAVIDWTPLPTPFTYDVLLTTQLDGSSCTRPDNGTGTVDFPQGCPHDNPDDSMLLVDGLPPGTTILFDGPLGNVANLNTMPGGLLGGETHDFDATFDWSATGSGDLDGFLRQLQVPLTVEVHSGPRNPGDPIQPFDTEIFRLQGELFGDPDFCELRVLAGSDLGLPCPGAATVKELPDGTFAVDSFFDVTYRIEFAGCPGGSLDGFAGVTTDTIRIFTERGPAWVRVPGVTPPWHHVDALLDPENYFYRVEPVPFVPTCVEPDNGTGTIDFPPFCPYDDPDEDPVEDMRIVDGLPPGSTILLRGPMEKTLDVDHIPGGNLGGGVDTFEGHFAWSAIGTGEFDGYTRSLSMPFLAEVHTSPRTPGDPVQAFDNELFVLNGELFGDPDFCVLRIRAGTGISLPSPGQSTLTELPSGDFAVDSFFDVTYEIEFEGCPGSPLDGLTGTSTGTAKRKAK